MARKDPPQDKSATLRTTIIAVTLIVVGVVLAAGLYYAMAPVDAQAGEHYQEIASSNLKGSGGGVVVREYFSYACVHCANFDDQIEDWQEDQGELVEFRRIPVMFSPEWRLLAQAYLTFSELGVLEENHSRMFRAVHERGQRFNTIEDLARWVDGRGTTAEAFRTAFSSKPVLDALREANRLTRERQIRGVPSLVVAGRYLISVGDVGRAASLDVADTLIERVRQE